MESKSLGLFLSVLGGIFIGIALITIWSMFLTWELWKGGYIILAIPFLAFGVSTMFFGIYLIFGSKFGSKIKGLIMIIDGIIPIIGTIIIWLDSRFLPHNLTQFIVFFPLLLVGIFLIIYGIFLILADTFIQNKRTRKTTNQVLGIVSALVGITNIVFFVILLISFIDHPLLFSVGWLALGAILIIFGIYLVIKKIEKK
ncbi:MAG: hypothetical protein ACFE8E_06810 [Candidatus Hodarchaeota archaeon]